MASLINATRRWVLPALLTGLLGVSHAYLKKGQDMTLEQMSSKSDSIVIGKVVGKQARFVGGRIETAYDIDVTEALKGRRAAGTRLNMTLAGGKLTTPPITQHAELQPHMFPGENVALFLNEKPLQLTDEQKKRAAPSSGLLTTPRVLGMNEGKFTVFTDKTDGRQKVARVSMEQFGYVHDDSQMESIVKAVASHQARVTSAPVVQSAANAAPPQKATESNPTLQMAKRNEAVSSVLSRQSEIAVQDFNEFKEQVRKSAK